MNSAPGTMEATHIAVMPCPVMGHNIPLLEFAKQLVINHNFQVSFLVITTTDDASSALDKHIRSTSIPAGLNIIQLPPVSISEKMQGATLVWLTIDKSLKSSLKSTLLQLPKLKLLVVDTICSQAYEICEEISIPVYSFFTCSISFLAFSLYLPTLDREVPEGSEFLEPVQVPGCSTVCIEDLLDQVKNRKINDYKWLLLSCSRLKLVAGIIVNSWDDLEQVAIQAIMENPFYKNVQTPPVHCIGPIVKQAEPLIGLDNECLLWLDRQPAASVLLVSLGSGGTLSCKQLSELAYGLELSQQRFIFVVRVPNDLTSSGTFLNAGSDGTDPNAYLPHGFLERTKDLGLVIPSWAAQVAILAHGSTGGFLSHCGWNSALESLVHGKPMIAWPLYSEQRMNASMLVKDVGVAVKPVADPDESVVGREEVERVVRLLMEGEEGKALRQKAKALQISASKALGFGGSSYEAIVEIVNKFKGT